jgi:hypothetical protein
MSPELGWYILFQTIAVFRDVVPEQSASRTYVPDLRCQEGMGEGQLGIVFIAEAIATMISSMPASLKPRSHVRPLYRRHNLRQQLAQVISQSASAVQKARLHKAG